MSMKNALKLVADYEPLPQASAATNTVRRELSNGLTALKATSPEQLIQEQIDELQKLITDLREKLTLTQWDLGQKEVLLHSCLQRELELRRELKGAWRY